MQFQSTLATAGAGTVEVANIVRPAGAVSIGNGATATLTLDGTTYTSTGAQTYEANDINITAGADVTFTTTNTAVEFQDGAAGQIVLSDDTDLIITTSGGNIILLLPLLEQIVEVEILQKINFKCSRWNRYFI